jgi:hypothetical protein
MPMVAAFARETFLLAGFPWDHHHAPVFDAAFRDDVVREVLYLRARAAQRGHFHAIIIVEMNMKRGQRQIMMSMVIFDQPPRQVTRSVIVDVDQRCDAFTRLSLFPRGLLHAGAGKIADRFGAILIAVLDGQGYSDLNFLIPELIGSVNIRKGPYFADEGDFSTVGSVHISLLDSVNKTMASITAGSFGYRRILGITSNKFGDGTLLVAGEADTYNGPWDNPDSLRKFNGILRYSQGTAENGFSLTGMAYANK